MSPDAAAAPVDAVTLVSIWPATGASFAGKYGGRVDDLIAFITARLDEDEAAAKLAAREGGTWAQADPGGMDSGSIFSLGGQVVCDVGAPDEYQAAHIARHDPARALREVAFKRAILAQREHGPAGSPVLTNALYQLAAVYSDHPDYRPWWSPSGCGSGRGSGR